MNVRAEIIEAALSGSSIDELEDMFVGVPLDGVMSDDSYTEVWNSEMIWNVLQENGDAAGMVMDLMEPDEAAALDTSSKWSSLFPEK